MKPKPIVYCIFLMLFFSCASKHEAVMPYYNMGYTADRLLPVEFSNADFEFRIWINNSTSIDRVISVSKVNDVTEKGEFYKGYTKSYLTEIGNWYRKRKSKEFYKQTNVTPKSGIDGFIAKIDSLKLSGYANQPDSDFSHAFDDPFSLYIVEIKENGHYHCFKFNTIFPIKNENISKYDAIQNLIFAEFHYTFYMK